ncbi:MAG: hypothetical protein D0528_02130 [Methylococcales bacterium]|nr:MAG: hypothetical protein D0528_02130 [Methylococcales bacterium]
MLLSTKILVSCIALILSGCYSIKMVKLGTVIKDNKTIEVPATGFSTMDIKSALAQDGWKIKVANENVQRNRLDSSNPKIDAKNQYDAGYRLLISESVRNNQWVIGISASVIDNKTNDEIFNMYCDSKGLGGCFPDDVAMELVKELKTIEK